MSMHSIAIIGAGYWGPNLIRCFERSARTRVSWVCDLDDSRLRAVRPLAPEARFTRDPRHALRDPEVSLVVVATPVFSHHKLAREALRAGKHVLVEKPLCRTVREASELLDLARRKDLRLMVDHTFLFTGAVQLMRDLVRQKELGDILYFDSVRVNLGLFQSDINVIWDLAPHDLSIMDFLLRKKPTGVSAVGSCHFKRKIENIGYLSVHFPDDTIAHFHLNWLAPTKIRKILIGGTRKMLVFDDLSPDEKIKVYDKGVSTAPMSRSKRYHTLVQYRIGDAFIPQVRQTREALLTEVEHVADCLDGRARSISDGEMGLRIVRILEAADRSLKRNGAVVSL